MTLWFVTPAWGRFDMSAICLEQRTRVIAVLAENGIEARSVVIADDDNLDIARGLGFDTVERDNEWLGRKFNDGYEFAGKNGAEWIVPIGSDSFIDPAYFCPLPFWRMTRTSRMYAPVEVDRLAELRVGSGGAGPHVIHRSLMAPKRFRPSPDRIMHNTDHGMLKGLARPVRWEYRDLHPLQYIGFRAPPFITRYDRLWDRWGVVERTDPWERLAAVFDADLVERARVAMSLTSAVV